MTPPCTRPTLSSTRPIPVPRLLLAGLAALAVVFGIGAPAAAQDEDDRTAAFEVGEGVFTSSCASCHSLDGSGSAAGRSLVDIAIEQPDRSVHIESVTNGKGGMPGFGSRLEAEEIDAVVSYVRLAFQTDDEPAEAPDELPNTGFESAILLLGLGLVAIGGSALVVSERALVRVRVDD